MVDLLVLGITIHEIDQVPILLLNPTDSDTVLPIIISPAEAFAVTTAMQQNSAISCFNDSDSFFPEALAQERAGERSKTPHVPHPASPTKEGRERTPAEDELESRLRLHEFFLQTVQALKGKVVAVELHSKRGEPIRGEAVIAGRELFRLPCTPADGISLALRTGAAIVASREVRGQAIEIGEIIEILPEHIQKLLRAALVSPHRTPTDGVAATVRQTGHDLLPQFSAIPAEPAPQGKAPVIRVSVVRKRVVDGREIEEVTAMPGTVTIKAVQPPRTEDERLADMLAKMVPETSTLM